MAQVAVSMAQVAVWYGTGSCIYGTGSCIYGGTGSCIYGTGSCIYGTGSCIYGTGSCIYGTGSCIYGTGSCIYGTGSCIYGTGSTDTFYQEMSHRKSLLSSSQEASISAPLIWCLNFTWGPEVLLKSCNRLLEGQGSRHAKGSVLHCKAERRMNCKTEAFVSWIARQPCFEECEDKWSRCTYHWHQYELLYYYAHILFPFIYTKFVAVKSF